MKHTEAYKNENKNVAGIQNFTGVHAVVVSSTFPPNALFIWLLYLR